jgi:hypothetical protein
VVAICRSSGSVAADFLVFTLPTFCKATLRRMVISRLEVDVPPLESHDFAHSETKAASDIDHGAVWLGEFLGDCHELLRGEDPLLLGRLIIRPRLHRDELDGILLDGMISMSIAILNTCFIWSRI